MDEEIAIIDSKTRNEKIKNFLIKNKKKLIIVFFLTLTIIFILIGYYNHKANVRIKISDDYNKATINFISDKKIIPNLLYLFAIHSLLNICGYR